MSITPLLQSTNRFAGRFLAIAALALAVGACDLGGRDRAPFLDSGMDAGSPDAGEDSGPADAGPDASFWEGDAGAWNQDPVEITGPCDNDCAYTYNQTPREDDDPYTLSPWGRTSFAVGPGATGDVIVAREVQKAFVKFVSSSSRGYRQRAIQSFVLDADTHDLVSGEAAVYNTFCGSQYDIGGSGIGTLKLYEFSYDSVAGELAYSVESGTRSWERVLEAPVPPIVMLNHREYPIEGFGLQSPLTAMLLAERYDWDLGGLQRVPIFSPEMERMDEVELAAGDEPDTLVVRYPIDTAKPPWQSWLIDAVYETNGVSISFEYGIPVFMGSRSNMGLVPVNAPSAELNLYYPTPVQELEFPAVPTGGEAIAATSGSFTLNGVVDAPAGAGPHAAVVMIPGWEYMTRRGEVGAVDLYAQLAQRLVAAGAVAARFDARGAGDNGTAFSEATLDDLIADAEAAVAAVQARADVDPARVFLLTTGAGVHVAAGAAAGGEVSVAGIVLIAPIGGAYADAALQINERYLKDNAYTSDGHLSAAQSALQSLFASLADGSYDGGAYRGHAVAAWQSLLAEDLVANPIALPPTLMLCGVEDHLIPAELVDELETALAGNLLADGGVDADAGAALTDVTTAILPGLTHALTPGTAMGLWPEHGGAETVDDGASTAMTDWLAAIAGGL